MLEELSLCDMLSSMHTCMYRYESVLSVIMSFKSCPQHQKMCQTNSKSHNGVVCCFSDVGMDACDALIDGSLASPSEAHQEAGSVQSSDSEFY